MTNGSSNRTDKNIAVLDLGTNTVILLIATVSSVGTFQVLLDQAVVVRLGEGIHKNSSFLPSAMDRTFSALKNFKLEIDKYHCEKVIAVGTAGFRNAHNAAEFIKRVRQELGISIDVISGEREAELVFRAAQADFSGLPHPLLVLDIGGGSTEFIIAETDRPRFAVSLPFGSVKLTENFLHGDPPEDRELTVLDTYLNEQLATLPKIGKPTLIATAGTATTIAALVQNLLIYDAERVHGSVVTLQKLKELRKKLESMGLNERQNLPCLEPKRADVIIAGIHILEATCERFNVDSFYVSDRGLRFGILADSIQ